MCTNRRVSKIDCRTQKEGESALRKAFLAILYQPSPTPIPISTTTPTSILNPTHNLILILIPCRCLLTATVYDLLGLTFISVCYRVSRMWPGMTAPLRSCALTSPMGL